MYHPTTRVLTILEMLQGRPGLSGAEITVDRLNVFKQRLTELKAGPGSSPAISELIECERRRFEDALDDDLNTAEALAAIHDFARETHAAMDREAVKAGDQQALLALLDRFDSVFNIFGDVKQALLDSDIQMQLATMAVAR